MSESGKSLAEARSEKTTGWHGWSRLSRGGWHKSKPRVMTVLGEAFLFLPSYLFEIFSSIISFLPKIFLHVLD
jgi:hypothetical protein